MKQVFRKYPAFRHTFFLAAAFLTFFFFAPLAHAVLFNVQYDDPESYGSTNYANDIVLDSSVPANAYVGGYYYSPTLETRIIKYNSLGVIVANSSIPDFQVESIARSSLDGSIYAVGGNEYSDGTVAMYDSELSLIRFVITGSVPGGFCDAHGDLNGVAVDATGVYVVGTYKDVPEIPPTGCNTDIYSHNKNMSLTKYSLDLTSQILSHKFYDSGSGNNDVAFNVAIDQNQNAYVAGCGNNYSCDDWIIVRFDSLGNSALVEVYGANPSDIARDIAVDPVSGNIYAAGQSRLSGPGFETRVVKYSPSLNIVWEKTEWPFIQSKATGVAVDKFGNLFVSGEGSVGSYPGWVQKYNSLGDLLFRYDFATTMMAKSVAVDNNLNFYATGQNGLNPVYQTVKILQRCNGTSTLPNYAIPWVDNPIVPNQTKIRAEHITQLREWIDDRRRDAGNVFPVNYPWAETIVPNETKIKLSHFYEMRTAISGAFSGCLNNIDFGEKFSTTTVKASDVTTLRQYTENHPNRPAQ